MEIWNKICGFISFFLFFSIISFAQSKEKVVFKPVISSQIKALPAFSMNIIPADYYTKNMGFFCKKELSLEKSTKIPLRLRLGSLNYCNYLEGKKY